MDRFPVGDLRLGLSVLILAITIAGPVQAATLSFSGTLGFVNFPSGPFLPGFPGGASGSGMATVNGSGAGLHLSTLAIGSVFGPVSVSLPITASATFQSVRFTGFGNQAGSFGPGLSGGAPGGGIMGVTGLMRICVIFESCDSSVDVPLSGTGAAGFGVGGRQLQTGPVSYTLFHQPWTIGQPVVTIHDPISTVTTPMLPGGFAHGAASGTSSTAAPSGTLQLVTVSKAYTSVTGEFPELVISSVLKLHFVAEPGSLWLLGSAALGFAARGRLRSQAAAARCAQSEPKPSRR